MTLYIIVLSVLSVFDIAEMMKQRKYEMILYLSFVLFALLLGIFYFYDPYRSSIFSLLANLFR